MAVRVRFAPSPTGHLHLGGLRTALFNYLFASSHNNGKCVLRIEDTDQERYVGGVIDKMMDTFNWLGIQFDESPTTGGPYGPYTQSQRLHHYQKHAQELIKKDAAYHCFCTKERLSFLKTRGGYDGLCRELSERQVNEKVNQGLPHVIRLKVNKEGSTVVNDIVYGNVSITNDSIDDQVLVKTNGYPTYHLANVIDDYMMEISHVLRGEEWLSSTCKHILLYKAFNWTVPIYAHLPILLSSSGGKLSKRKDSVYVHDYQERGFLSEAIINFIALLGWNPKTCQELFTLDQLKQSFNLEGLNKASAVVDEKKLCWFNSQYANQQYNDSNKMKHFVSILRETLLKDKDTFNLTANDYKLSFEYLSQVITLIKESSGLMTNIPQQASYFWIDPDLSQAKPPPNDRIHMYKDLIQAIEEEKHDLTDDRLNTLIESIATDNSVTTGKVLSLLRYALTGGKAGPSVISTASILGKTTVLNRLLKAKD